MKAPKPTSPEVTAAAQNNSNLYSANTNTIAQSGTVTNPYGVKTTTLRPNEIIDPVTGKKNTVYSADVNEKLSQGQQNIFDANQGSEFNLAKYGQQQTQQLLDRGGTPFSYNVGEHEKWAGNTYNAMNAETNAANDEALRSRLSAQGIKQGSTAYDREMANYAKGRDNARNQFMLDAQGQGYQQAMATRNQQTNEPLAIATGTQIQQPQFTPGRAGNVATTDMASIYNNYDQQKMNRYQSNMASLGGLFSGLGSVFALSDRRAKTNIEKIGKAGGHNIYSYDYKPGFGQPKGRHIGVMAQEVLKKVPEAIAKGADGFMRVNYSKAFSLGA